MPYENEHAARIREPNTFDPKTFRRTEGGKAVLPGSGLTVIPKTVSVIWGKLKGSSKPSDQPVVQALRFPVASWTEDKAKKWLKDNKVKFISFEAAEKAKDEIDETTENTTPMKQLLLYSPIWDFTAEKFVEKLNEIDDDEDIKIRILSPGGSVFAGWAIIGRMQERTGKNNIAIDGLAASMGFIFAAYGDYVESLDVSRFLVHAASGYAETEDQKKFLDGINVEILGKLKKKINLDKFKEITGKTLDSVFKATEKMDVWLTAKEAKDIGLVDKIVRLDPAKLKAYTEKFVAFFDFDEDTHGSVIVDDIETHGSEEEPETKINVKQKPFKKMTKKEFQASDPDVFSEILAEGSTSGTNAERDRVRSWLAFIDIDKDAVIKAIKEGTLFTQSVMAEMTVKATSKQEVKKIEADAAVEIKTDPILGEAEKKKKDVEAFEKELKDGTNLKNLVQ